MLESKHQVTLFVNYCYNGSSQNFSSQNVNSQNMNVLINICMGWCYGAEMDDLKTYAPG